MPPVLPNIPRDFSFTDRDFTSLAVRFRALARSVWPDWTDFTAPDGGTLLLGLMAFLGDNLHFYIDRTARQNFWGTATQRLAAIRLGRLIDFRLTGAAPATATVRFSVAVAAPVAIPIPIGTRLRTNETTPQAFRTTAAGTIAIGQTFVDVAVEQAEVITETLTSAGTPGQIFSLSRTPYLDGSASASTVGEGAFTEVQTFLGVDADDRVFVILVDDEDRARLLFGTGRNGRIPTGTITVTSKVGGGSRGNVAAGTIRTLDTQLVDSLGAPVTVAVTNAAPATGGVDRMTIEQARLRGPAALRTQRRSVSRPDFEDHALGVAGVARAMLATANEDAAVAENAGRLAIVAAGTRTASGRTLPATPSAALLALVTTEVTVTRPPPVTFLVTVEAAAFFAATISVRVALASGAGSAATAARIRANLIDFYAALLADGTANPEIDFGANLRLASGAIAGEIPWSTIFNVIRDTTGVRKVDESPTGLLVNGVRAGHLLTARQFPALGTVTIVDVDTGLAI